MKLKAKGKIIPPPELSKYSEIVSKKIQQWPEIISATHWEIWDNNKPNGADFYFGEEELGHIHLDDWLHIPSTKEFSKALIAEGLAQKFIYAANWIQFKIVDEQSADHATWLFKLHYDKLNGGDSEKIFQSIFDYKGKYKLALSNL